MYMLASFFLPSHLSFKNMYIVFKIIYFYLLLGQEVGISWVAMVLMIDYDIDGIEVFPSLLSPADP